MEDSPYSIADCRHAMDRHAAPALNNRRATYPPIRFRTLSRSIIARPGPQSNPVAIHGVRTPPIRLALALRGPSHPCSRFLDRSVENFPDNGLIHLALIDLDIVVQRGILRPCLAGGTFRGVTFMTLPGITLTVPYVMYLIAAFRIACALCAAPIKFMLMRANPIALETIGASRARIPLLVGYGIDEPLALIAGRELIEPPQEHPTEIHPAHWRVWCVHITGSL
uniref:Uncharacterized protein n=1 Tax=Candidatus Kentrum sp. LPFa TaxID=2126335 RepID=A0A450XSI7_9GAMM|nr:MAG: hypothetical protein BECKLPF1236A_GA0070988_101611 [Candidatus Kentron sp. LPFa]VFK32229.1 MAG: hypothetical protein BECKLPF1236C_GA0070990_101611 [Candidatus Kentron sp. LPFa]